MDIASIKAAVDAGQTVHWANHGYIVVKDSLGEYLIKYIPSGWCCGLTNRAGDKLNGKPSDFYLASAPRRRFSCRFPSHVAAGEWADLNGWRLQSTESMERGIVAWFSD